MEQTKQFQTIHASKYRRTKIIATVGPATKDYETILGLIEAGANGLRLNFSHGGNNDEWEKIIKLIRKASEACDKPVAIIQDLQGPKIRLGDFEGIINVEKHQELQFQYKSDYERSGIIPLQYDLSKKVKRGQQMYLFDGKIQTVITAVHENGLIQAEAKNDGILISRKGINLPDTDFGGDIITLKDSKDIAFGSTQDIDYVALSFVQAGRDVEKLKNKLKSLGSKARVIAKIETKAAVENINEIFQEADVIMVARGDLAIETTPESVPVTQRHIIGLGLQHKKPTIVATQMLASMTESSEPTRAEVSDVATAVIVGADSVMLSEETAIGQYPIEAVKVMKRVINYTQRNSDVRATFTSAPKVNDKQYAISKAIINLAKSISASAIVAETKSGGTAVNIASQRPDSTIIAVASEKSVANQLAIVYGVKSYQRPVDKFAATKLTNWLVKEKVLEKGDVIITASGNHPGVVGTTDTIKVRVI